MGGGEGDTKDCPSPVDTSEVVRDWLDEGQAR